MAINVLNQADIEEVAQLATRLPQVRAVAYNFHTPYPGTEALALSRAEKLDCSRRIVRLIDQGYPVLNLKSALPLIAGQAAPVPSKHCLVAENGQQGLDKAKTEPAIDLILMDVNMPVMDGFEAVKRIREWEAASGAPRRPVIALTADAFEEDRERCLAAGMDDHLSKPVGLKALRDALGKHLTQKRNA